MPYSSKVALLGNIIDYAGTFPPAALSLPKALERAATFRSEGKNPWLYGRIALPLSDIKTLTSETYFNSGSDGAPWVFTALGTTPASPELADLNRTLEWDLREIRHFNQKNFDASARMFISSYETKLPVELLKSKSFADYSTILSPILDRILQLMESEIDVFFETPFQEHWVERVVGVAEAFSSWVHEVGEGMLVPGIKIRTGGQQVPTPEQLSEIVVSILGRGLRFKATQGLHEAITHGDSIGFVNLFAAIAFFQGLGHEEFDSPNFVECLKCETANDFRFEKDSLHWKKFRLSCEAIEAGRRRHGASFGSCSLDEPDESLAKIFPEARKS